MKSATHSVGNVRLLKLAAFLEKLPRKRFDYASVVGYDWQGKPDLSCGTTACAIGWAAAMPQFQKLGLKLDFDPVYGNSRLEGGVAKGKYNPGTAIFEISDDEWDYLFQPGWNLTDDAGTDLPLPVAPDADATPKQVAKHIRRFVAWRKKQ